MSLDSAQTVDQPITSTDELVSYFRAAEKSAGARYIGIEHEKLLFAADRSLNVPYEGPNGIGTLLEKMTAFGWVPFREKTGSPIIALTRGKAAVSLEPGGQLELSGSPFLTAREAHQENLLHIQELKQILPGLGLHFEYLGYRPQGTVQQMSWMPKSRYQMMRQSLGTRGSLALDMMLMTATGQASLDWENEADCVQKTTTTARFAPLLVALYANSPIVNGSPSGFLSYRSHVWSDVDNARCGYLPSFFDGSFSYRSYVDWALDAPMLFVRRNGEYRFPNVTFRQFIKNGFEGKPAQQFDWVDHLSTLFPEVRIKTVMEFRSADGCSPEMTGALAALLRGLIYGSGALEAVQRLLPPVTYSQHLELHQLAQKEALHGVWQGKKLNDWCKELVSIARSALQKLDAEDVPLLQPLDEILKSGVTLAERQLGT